MSEYGTVLEAGTVRIARTLPGPVEKVWDYLTDSKKRGEWLAPGLMELRVGGRVELEFHHADLTPHEETVPEKYTHMKRGRMLAGTVTRCEPPTLLAYTWGEGVEGASEVTFELSARGAEVLLVITHRGLDGRMMPSVAAGWHTHVGILIDKMSGRTPSPFWATHARLSADYERRFSTA